MNQFDGIIERAQGSDDFMQNANILRFVANIMINDKKRVTAADIKNLHRFAVAEMDKLMNIIPSVENYEKKDEIFCYADALMQVFTLTVGNKDDISDTEIKTVTRLTATISAERTLENAINVMFDCESIDVAEVNNVLEIVKPIKDEYRRGLLYAGLHEYCEKIDKLTTAAKSAFAEYIAVDMARLTDDIGENDKYKMTALEYAADVCKYFATPQILDILDRLIEICNNNIRYYAIETLLENGRTVTAETVRLLAEDLNSAAITYSMLQKHGKTELFPSELNTPEYIAKSDIVHWLCYPTELNKPPYEIELIGSIKVHGELFHVFKYKTDSENLSEELQNEYLIGWSGNCGGTFSNFDPLKNFIQKTPQKTLKYIAKKLLK